MDRGTRKKIRKGGKGGRVGGENNKRMKRRDDETEMRWEEGKRRRQW